MKTPIVGQKAVFFPANQPPESGGVEAEVTHVWSDTCVNLKCADETLPTSVLVVQPGWAPPHPNGYYCLLLEDGAVEEAKADVLVQPKITGYRQLSPAEAALMNRVKAAGAALDEVVQAVAQHIQAQEIATRMGDVDLVKQHQVAQPGRWVAIARTDLRQGLMALTRAVAQPQGF